MHTACFAACFAGRAVRAKCNAEDFELLCWQFIACASLLLLMGAVVQVLPGLSLQTARWVAGVLVSNVAFVIAAVYMQK